MLKDAKWYFCHEILPQYGAILKGPELYIAIAASLGFTFSGETFVVRGLKIGELCSAFLTYSSIAMGFCLAGLTIALTLPDSDFVKSLAASKHERAARSSYANLLFVFSWTAVCHWVAIVVCVLAYFRFGTVVELFPSPPAVITGLHRLAVFLFLAVNFYCVCQFFIVLVTISQVGSMYIAKLSETISSPFDVTTRGREGAALPPPVNTSIEDGETIHPEAK